MIDVLDILADDKQIVLLRTRWNSYTGGFLSSVVLQQIFYHWNNRGRKPFFKFLQPCEHKKYRRGDSWEEELNISRKEFSTALKTIAFKRTEKTRKHQSSEQHTFPVEYWTDGDRVTHYTIHEDNFRQLLARIYPAKSEAQNADIAAKDTLNPQRGFSSEPTKIPKGDLPLNPQRGFSKSPKGDLALHYTENKIKDHTHTQLAPKVDFPLSDETACVCGSATQEISSVSETPETPETLTLLAEATSLNVSTLKNLMAAKKASLNGLYHAFTYIRKHKEKVATIDPTGETFLRKTGLHLFDERGNFTRANGTGHIDIPALQAWFYRLTPDERKRILEPSLTPNLLTLKKSERWLHPDFQQVVFAAAQQYGKENPESSVNGKAAASQS